jgi:hypothetical protein
MALGFTRLAGAGGGMAVYTAVRRGLGRPRRS